MTRTSTPSRTLARAAVRGELVRVAFALFDEHGYDAVTLEDIAAASGMSRSTVLRASGGKEQLALGVFHDDGEAVAVALAARPHDEDVWTALRRALDVVVAREHTPDGLAAARLVQRTPVLWARLHERQHSWAALLAPALLVREPGAGRAAGVWAMAALGCLGVAVDQWVSDDGRTDLGALLDDAFAALEARAPLSGRERHGA